MIFHVIHLSLSILSLSLPLPTKVHDFMGLPREVGVDAVHVSEALDLREADLAPLDLPNADDFLTLLRDSSDCIRTLPAFATVWKAGQEASSLLVVLEGQLLICRGPNDPIIPATSGWIVGGLALFGSVSQPETVMVGGSECVVAELSLAALEKFASAASPVAVVVPYAVSLRMSPLMRRFTGYGLFRQVEFSLLMSGWK